MTVTNPSEMCGSDAHAGVDGEVPDGDAAGGPPDAPADTGTPQCINAHDCPGSLPACDGNNDWLCPCGELKRCENEICTVSGNTSEMCSPDTGVPDGGVENDAGSISIDTGPGMDA
jgi:hypothetical protein